MIALDFTTVLLLGGAALLAGFIDAIAGGGGLLTVPALMLAGLDPVAAIATNKAQGAAGALSSTYAFARAGRIDRKIGAPVAIAAALAGIAGALSVTLLSRAMLQAAAPLLLIAIALYFLAAPKLGDEDARARMSLGAFAMTIVPIVGFSDGLFGPGAGSFYVIGFIALLGFGIVKATAHTKLANAASNVGGLALYAATGAVVWPVGLAMALFAFLGAQIGAILAMRAGARLIRPMLVVISCAMAIRLMADPANPIRHAIAGLLGR